MGSQGESQLLFLIGNQLSTILILPDYTLKVISKLIVIYRLLSLKKGRRLLRLKVVFYV